jgi:hypothetical protein
VTEGKALTLVVVGTLLLSAVIDVVLLLLHAGGAALAVGMVAVLIPCSFATSAVMHRYSVREERRKREEILLSR